MTIWQLNTPTKIHLEPTGIHLEEMQLYQLQTHHLITTQMVVTKKPLEPAQTHKITEVFSPQFSNRKELKHLKIESRVLGMLPPPCNRHQDDILSPGVSRFNSFPSVESDLASSGRFGPNVSSVFRTWCHFGYLSPLNFIRGKWLTSQLERTPQNVWES